MSQQTVTVYVSNLPVGAIIMWNGLPNEVPANWAICNGSHNTPDLRNLFIVGAGSQYSLGNTGGSQSVQLSIDQMPSHSHDYMQFSILDTTWKSGGSKSPGNGTGGNVDAFTESNGSGSPHENRPPFYALYYIMKIA